MGHCFLQRYKHGHWAFYTWPCRVCCSPSRPIGLREYDLEQWMNWLPLAPAMEAPECHAWLLACADISKTRTLFLRLPA